ncbi:MAG: hypothetical protein O3A66_01560 [Proteobacteria bacterium]|nr:hypothetical protein [Pseudomonadota bacterium]
MGLSPAFWVAVSFFVFIAFAWRFVRTAFLNAINNYRNSISSSLSDLYLRRDDSAYFLEKSHQELEDSNLNGFVLNAHKIAKEILEKSQKTVEKIQNSMGSDVAKSVSSIQSFLEAKMAYQVTDATSNVVKLYLQHNQVQFNQVAVKSVLNVLSK